MCGGRRGVCMGERVNSVWCVVGGVVCGGRGVWCVYGGEGQQKQRCVLAESVQTLY